ncbi:Xaa-Pro dipeptidase [Pyrenophora seminiperda CCB06]|uniref:Xaa-Pro aminopeptidase n=1 Tax=Pyrenophora seminiperda CCB06 TaxID=1302712 RepID=A0A3M7MG70_9PLEO|nr:Xaa-Pro dipeptidase [Pyrenophora seminiperda CCB06]
MTSCIPRLSLHNNIVHRHSLLSQPPIMTRILLPFASLVAVLSPLVHAGIKFTSPAAGAQLTAGTAIAVQWSEGGTGPKLTDLQSYQLQLVVGGNKGDEQATTTITPSGLFTAGNQASGRIENTISEDLNKANAYFVKMIAVAKTGGQFIVYSDRFSYAGMKGKNILNPVVKAAALAVTDTAGPAAEDNTAEDATATTDTPNGDVYNVQYTMQTGLTRYAPMQPVPPTKITATNMKPLYPTSSVQIAKTRLPIPSQLTTLTASQTYSVSSMENTVAAASHATDDMAKFLRPGSFAAMAQMNNDVEYFRWRIDGPSLFINQPESSCARLHTTLNIQALLMRTLLPHISRSLRHTLRRAAPAPAPATATPCFYSLSSESGSWTNIVNVNVDVKMAIAENYEEVLKGKYPAKAHAKKVAEWIVAKGGDGKGTIYLEGQKMKLNEDNDGEAPFRQRRYFFYLSGCELPDSYLTYEIATEKLTLFIPPVEPDEVIWSGLPMSPEEAKAKYDIDECLTTKDVNAHLASTSESAQSTLYAIPEQVSDHVTFLSYKEKEFKQLKTAIEYCRVTKSDYEIALIRKANVISTAAHEAVMKAASTAKNECELEAVFLKACVERNAKNQAYHSIVAAGEHAATLHYVHNAAPISGQNLLLLDAGCEIDCYASDITRTFPLKGKFTDESLAIYKIVLDMQHQCINALKEGVVWDHVHELAHKIAIKGLLELGILKGDAEEIFTKRISVAFFPHGLGHYLGMDTHDTGGNPNYADKDIMFRYLRTRGSLPARSVITVEPGVYFCRFIIEPYLKDEEKKKYIDTNVLEKYWSVGGVRIEDNILITKDGFENLTPTPKEIDEITGLATLSALEATLSAPESTPSALKSTLSALEATRLPCPRTFAGVLWSCVGMPTILGRD